MLAVALIVVIVVGLFAVAMKAHGRALPTFADLEASNHAAARALDDAALAAAVRGLLARLGDAGLEAEIAAVLAGRRAREGAGARWSAGLWDAVRRRGDAVRPGTVEELWFAEGALREYARRRSA